MKSYNFLTKSCYYLKQVCSLLSWNTKTSSHCPIFQFEKYLTFFFSKLEKRSISSLKDTRIESMNHSSKRRYNHAVERKNRIITSLYLKTELFVIGWEEQSEIRIHKFVIGYYVLQKECIDRHVMYRNC